MTRAAAALTAALAWLGLGTLYAALLSRGAERGRTWLEVTGSFFGFFTNLTNLLVAVGLTAWVVAPRSRVGAFFGRPGTTAATALYIVVVALVYTLMLRAGWQPTGWLKVADVLLHDVVPAAYLLCWLLLLPKGGLPWRTVWSWLIYPAVYFTYTLLRGAYSDRYPYPFLDVARFGYGRVFLNGVVLLFLFLLLGLVFVALDRRLRRSPRFAPAPR